jgi:carbamoyl-phosphate synthase small subunit
MTACLVLQDGTTLHGQSFGAAADTVFELVFNTSMTGYQEILTDPSYRGQAVLFTCSHIGNVGINEEDNESAAPQAAAAVICSLSRVPSNWRSTRNLSDWLAEYGVPGISGVDTRFLTSKLRDGGTQKAALSTCGTTPEKLLQMAQEWPGLDGRDTVKEVTCTKSYTWEGDPGDKWVPQSPIDNAQASIHIVAYDYGMKRNILRHLAAYGAHITVVPADTPAEATLALNPDGVFLSNGPGDPEGLPYAVEAVQALLDSNIPIMAMGGRKRRLKFGHHGGNHPVQHLPSGKVLITAQNHNYFIETDSLDPAKVEITYVSLNDNSLEGLRLKGRPVASVQFHPEAAPGPHDAHAIFGEFFENIRMYQHD